MNKKNDFILNSLITKYNLDNKEKKEFINIIKNIYYNDNFQKRFNNTFLHHGTTSVSEHTLQVAIKTYKLSKKIKNEEYEIDIAVIIAMLHDLYESPWQNSKIKTRFFNKHGFRHPIEACINSIYWFPELFKNKKKAEKIIDGIIHHMYPLAVSRFDTDKINSTELQNFTIIKKIPKENIKLIIKSTSKMKLARLSFSPPKYKEGRIMSKADKLISIKQFNNIHDFIALLTGKNKKLK